jgi:peptidoglycan hydrolase CwlO-like protein
MNSSALAEWAMFIFGIGTVIVALRIGAVSSKVLSGKSVQEVVNSANAIIEMYEKHVGALESEVNGLRTQVASLESKLDETLKHNEALQKLLMVSPAMTVHLQPPGMSA